MGFLYSTLPFWVSIGGWIVALGALAAVVWRKPFSKLDTDAVQHLWLSTLVTLSVLWTFDIWVQDGAVFHLLGATLMVTLFGWSLALIGSCLVVVLVAVILGTPWEGIGLTMVALGVVPVVVSALLQALLTHVSQHRHRHRRVPFILGHGIITPVFAVLASSGAMLFGHLVLRDLSWNQINPSFGTMTLVQACGEAVFTAAMTAIIAVYKPAWMTTFDKRLNRIDR